MDIVSSLLWLGLALLISVTASLVGGHLFLLDLAILAVLMAVVTAVYPELPGSVQLGLYFGGALALMPILSWLAARVSSARRGLLVGAADDYQGRSGVILARPRGVAVRIDGEEFPARVLDPDPLQPGAKVAVVRFEGITAIVRCLRD